jgi:prepilin-type N-terminal cleavage/methylation domain-containing protein
MNTMNTINTRKAQMVRSSPNPCSHLPRRKRIGFTLIELLVVIAIIAILASILLPALAASRMKALDTKCLSNVKQLTLAAKMYNDDTGEAFSYNDGSDPNDTHSIWMGCLLSYYAKATNLLMCPSTHVQLPTPQSDSCGTADKAWYWPASGTSPAYNGSYGLNGYLYDIGSIAAGDTSDTTGFFGKPGDIQRPAMTPYMFDAMWDDCWPEESDAPNQNLYNGGGSDRLLSSVGGLQRECMSRHGWSKDPSAAPQNVPAGPANAGTLPGGINMGCADGHGELAKLIKLWNYYWNAHWVPPARIPPVP